MTRAELARKSGLLLDTNLLVLLVIGQYDPKRINGHKRLQSYTSEDYYLLLGFMSLFRTFATTPNILTEVSNLLEGDSYQYGPVLAIVPQLLAGFGFVELHEPSIPIMSKRNKEFLKFGLSDVVSCSALEQNYLFLTDDLRLCYYLENNGLSARNFNHIRSSTLIH